VIRQAISCDICGTDKQQTNHWFVAYDQGAELRITGWNTRSRLRTGAKHLCGQTCLHKLVDDFMAHTLSTRVPPVAERSNADAAHSTPPALRVDASLTSAAAHPAPPRPTPAHPDPARPVLPPPTRPGPVRCDPYSDEYESSARLVAPPESNKPTSSTVPSTPPGNSRTWQTEAWKRELERTAAQPAKTRRRSIA
jgi:hypothetical protein